MDRILMFSGGLDSFVLKAVNHFENEECLFVDMGTAENKMEWGTISKLFPGVKRVEFKGLNQFGLPNKIIPFRNNFLTLIGAQFARQIYFAFTAGDTTRDKDWVFKAQMEGQLNYFAGTPKKIGLDLRGRAYEIRMPFKNLTKADIVGLYLEQDNPTSLIYNSISCYEGGARPCGKCRSCLRKYVAVTVAIDRHKRSFKYVETMRQLFVNDPLDYLNEFLEQSKVKGRGKEVHNIKECLLINS